MIYGLGMLESGITFDYGQLVLDAEMVRMIKCVLKGIPVDDETLGTDVIQEVGHFGDFLCHKHTMQRMRSQSQPSLIDRSTRENWQKKGSKDVYTKALEKARQILESHKPEPLPQNAREQIRAMIEKIEGIEK